MPAQTTTLTSPPEARSGLDPWKPADLPAAADAARSRLARRRRPRRHRPRRVYRRRRVPARADGLRPARPDAALGDDHRRVLPDRLQHRADALHARDRRAGVHRLHADAAALRRSGAWFYAILFFLQVGWPASAAVASGAIFFLVAGRLPGPADVTPSTASASATFLLCVAAPARRPPHRAHARDLELGSARVHARRPPVLALLFVPGGTWLAGSPALSATAPQPARFDFLPANADFFLIAAFVAYSGAGGDDEHHAVELGARQGLRDGPARRLHSGRRRRPARQPRRTPASSFTPTPENMARWRGWWRIVRADQWGVFCVGAIVGMMLPALLYVTYLPAGTNIQGLGISAALASSLGAREGALLAASSRRPRRLAALQDAARPD